MYPRLHEPLTMNPPSPCLIALDNPLPNLTLLDDDDEVDEDFEVASSSLGPTAPAFTSRKEPVSLLEGLLIDLADGSTVVFRPASGSKQDYLSPRPPPFGPSVHTRRSFIGPSATKSQLPTKKARAPLVELHLNTGSSAFTPDSDSPSPPWPLEDTPEVTPPSSFSSRASSPGFLPPSAVHDQPILIYTPKEVADPFKLDAVAHPYIDIRSPTRGRGQVHHRGPGGVGRRGYDR